MQIPHSNQEIGQPGHRALIRLPSQPLHSGNEPIDIVVGWPIGVAFEGDLLNFLAADMALSSPFAMKIKKNRSSKPVAVKFPRSALSHVFATTYQGSKPFCRLIN